MRNRFCGSFQQEADLLTPRWVKSLMCMLIAVAATSPGAVWAQQSLDPQALLEAGEFATVAEVIDKLPEDQAATLATQLAQQQIQSGSLEAAYQTLQDIPSDAGRSDAIDQLQGNFSGQLNQQGGVTINDFQPLVNLIQSVISPDTWNLGAGNGEGSILPYAAGVYVDASQVLKRLKSQPKNRLKRFDRKFARKKILDARSASSDVLRQVELRTISLKRLEREMQLAAVAGRQIDETMRNMAGIYQIDYVMLDAANDDILIAGPAGPWRLDADRRSVNVETNLPTLQLDDLIVCMHNAFENGGKFGCTIVPRQKALVAAQTFLATSKLKGKAWQQGLRDSVGLQKISVRGIDPNTETARTIVEADYLMKRIGMGLEASVDSVPNYFDRIKGGPGQGPKDQSLVRWWFSMNYDSIASDRQQQIFEFSGNGVEVLSENEHVDRLGQRIHTGKSDDPTAGFADDFTKNYSEMANQYPVFASLRNVFDLAMVAGIVKHYDLSGRSGWQRSGFIRAMDLQHVGYQVRRGPSATQVQSIVNSKLINYRNQGKRYRQTIAAVSGGVDFDFQTVVDSAKYTQRSQASFDARPQRPEQIGTGPWWWD